MNLGLRQIITTFAALLTATIMPAQEVPVLAPDPAVSEGVLPNGLSYYLVANPAVKGTADFALVQKTGRLTSADYAGGKAVDEARKSLSSLRRVGSPSDFLARRDAVYGRDGYVKVTDDATVFRFSEIRLKGDALDSMLLVIMDIVDRPSWIEDEYIEKWYTPADQAVVISGDIDSKVVASKLNSMSYMIPARESADRPEYSDATSYEPASVSAIPGNPSLSTVSATWKSKRAPREYMNTVQSEIFEMSLNTLGKAAVSRMKKALRAMDIPAAEVSYEHICSSTYPYDDSITIFAVVASEDASDVSAVMAEIMASIKGYGVGRNEYLIAESSYIQEITSNAELPFTSNGDYVDRCVNAFLYNAPLASSKEKLAFHTSRDLPDTMRQRFFNDIAKAVIDTVWTGKPAVPYDDAVISDTLYSSVVPGKLKIKSSKKEPVSGGVTWTFTNGFKVIYRNMPSDRMYYGLALNGGYAGIGNLEAGEGAFLSDYFRTCRVADMTAEEFIGALRMEGVTMDMTVNMSNTMVSGSLPKEKMPLLLRSLLLLANERTSDEAAFDYYKRSEYMALDNSAGSFYTRMTAIDSIVCPDYRYSSYKVKGKLSDDFLKKAEAFCAGQFSKMNDGVLIIVGNMNEEKLKKELLAHVGEFRVSDNVSRKPSIHYQAVSGTSTYTVEGREESIDVVISSRLPVTMENYIAAEFAARVLKRRLSEEFRDSGICFSLIHECWIYPEERVNVLISVSEASAEGFQTGIGRKAPIGILGDVRSALSGLGDIEISDDELNAWKTGLKHQIALEMKSPAYWIDAIALRYLIGKDLSTGYAAKIDAVTADKVRSVLAVLGKGCKVEYVTIKK